MHGLTDWRYRVPWAMAVGATLLAFWALLSGGSGWLYGIPAAALGALAGAWLAPGQLHQPRPLAILRFLGIFLAKSLGGGVDVAGRALHPAMPLRPGWTEYSLRLTTPAAQSLFLITVSLTPGTLGADLRDGVMRVHTLTPSMEDNLPGVERAIAAIFGDEPEEARA